MKTTVKLFLPLLFVVFLQNCSEQEFDTSVKVAEESGVATNTKRLNAIDVSAFTILADPGPVDPSNRPFTFFLNGTPGKRIVISWGDGSAVETTTFTDRQHSFQHSYPTDNQYTISITGDIKHITRFSTAYGVGNFSAVNVKPLTGLIEFSTFLNRAGSVLDFGSNTSLEELGLGGSEEIQSIILPRSHKLKLVDIDGPNRLPAATVEYIINNVYRNTVLKNITGGYFLLRTSWDAEEGDSRMVGPPSSESIKRLKILRDVYGWTIVPRIR